MMRRLMNEEKFVRTKMARSGPAPTPSSEAESPQRDPLFPLGQNVPV